MNDDVITAAFDNTAVDGSPFAHVLRLVEIADICFGMRRTIGCNDRLGVVGGSIIDHHNLFLKMVDELYGDNLIEYGVNGGSFVVNGYDDGELHVDACALLKIGRKNNKKMRF